MCQYMRVKVINQTAQQHQLKQMSKTRTRWVTTCNDTDDKGLGVDDRQRIKSVAHNDAIRSNVCRKQCHSGRRK